MYGLSNAVAVIGSLCLCSQTSVSLHVTKPEVPRCQMQAKAGGRSAPFQPSHVDPLFMHRCVKLYVRKRESRLLSAYTHGQFFQSHPPEILALGSTASFLIPVDLVEV